MLEGSEDWTSTLWVRVSFYYEWARLYYYVTSSCLGLLYRIKLTVSLILRKVNLYYISSLFMLMAVTDISWTKTYLMIQWLWRFWGKSCRRYCSSVMIYWALSEWKHYISTSYISYIGLITILLYRISILS
jgi:hypothetical protein